jgi:hypothetical protein
VNKAAVAAWKEELQKLLANLPKEYGQAKAALAELSRTFHQDVAVAFTPRLNQRLEEMAQHTLEQCRDLASFCNSELHDLHLCIRCPRTGNPATLITDIRSLEQDAPRFRLQLRGARGKVTRTYTSRELPRLELMEDSPRHEGLRGSGRG